MEERTRRRINRRNAQSYVFMQSALALVVFVSFCINPTRAYSAEFPIWMVRKIRGQRRTGRYLDRQRSARKDSTRPLRGSESNPEDADNISDVERNLLGRISRLETLVSKQEIEIYRLRKENDELKATAAAFAKILQVLRERSEGRDPNESIQKNSESEEKPLPEEKSQQKNRVVESFDDSMIFGTAPTSVDDAADAAGAAILASVLAGKQRMLVDVRDAELSSDPETLVQFIELAILPIAAGLEGLKSTRNRVKIVFPTVSQLLEYRRTMALAAPEVVALSTLGFDPVERRDKLVVIVAPPPDDEEGQKSMRELLYPSDGSPSIEQPVVILNYHMVPVSLATIDFETAYHLRLLSVQYMTGEAADEILQSQAPTDDDETMSEPQVQSSVLESDEEASREEQIEAAMRHVQKIASGVGVTRAMVIRSYPRCVWYLRMPNTMPRYELLIKMLSSNLNFPCRQKRPWHVFVDVSPNTDTDYEVAATFDEEPGLDDINMAIMECLEGSEREDELVAQQMQQALEGGQLDRISSMIGEVLDRVDPKDIEDDDGNDDDFDMYEEDSV